MPCRDNHPREKGKIVKCGRPSEGLGAHFAEFWIEVDVQGFVEASSGGETERTRSESTGPETAFIVNVTSNDVDDLLRESARAERYGARELGLDSSQDSGPYTVGALLNHYGSNKQ